MTSELTTPDGRYIVIQGRLWRAANPSLPAEAKVRHMRELLNGRRALKAAKTSGDEEAVTAARKLIAAAQAGLGERGKVWWKDGAPDYNRTLADRRGAVDARLTEYRWLLEELRVSFFAQELRTPQPVSVKRLDKAWEQLSR